MEELTRTPSVWEVSPALQEAVDKYIAQDPVRYRAAQSFGEFLVDHPQFSKLEDFKVEQRDIVGDELMYQEICKVMRYYGIKPIELEQFELTLLKDKLGDEWKEHLMKEYGFEKDDFPDN